MTGAEFNPAEIARAAVPEVMLAAVALIVLLLDVIAFRGAATDLRAKRLGALTAIGVALTFVVTWGMRGQGTIYADASRILVVDDLAVTLKLAILVLTLGTVL